MFSFSSPLYLPNSKSCIRKGNGKRHGVRGINQRLEFKQCIVVILKENLLTALCTQSGVRYDPNEEVMIAAARHIVDERQASGSAGPSHIPPSSAYASSSIPNRMTRVEEDLDHIRYFQDYQVKHNQAIAEMLRTMALHHGMNLDNFPTCPSYMPPRDKAMLDDDDDDYDDDDEDEDEEDEDEEDEE
ncbi:hypothetical protein K7X08_035809 [Anisodus acutangulus]|uniref:Uncharacterized protein n=1 Tax=Anisodus acutangulus TaxID=402998 RepID=A0A9Q1L8C6_9SOLA|nr:hypothetical protein K7X08_035809 [Anisodus acutangulus]